VQALGGVRFRINSNMDPGLGYEFLADFPNEGRYLATHSVMAGFTVTF
jgi:opacity protein-like surface antigen